jgi:hypothetical protein
MQWRAEVISRLRGVLDPPDAARALIVSAGAEDAAALRSLFPTAVAVPLESTGDDAPGTAAVQSLDVVVIWLALRSVSTSARRRLLARARELLRVGGALVVIDQSRPRTWWLRVRNAVWCVCRGRDPWWRPAYPTARDVDAAAFADVRLRLACGERIQIVCARRTAPSARPAGGSERLDTAQAVG